VTPPRLSDNRGRRTSYADQEETEKGFEYKKQAVHFKSEKENGEEEKEEKEEIEQNVTYEGNCGQGSASHPVAARSDGGRAL